MGRECPSKITSCHPEWGECEVRAALGPVSISPEARPVRERMSEALCRRFVRFWVSRESSWGVSLRSKLAATVAGVALAIAVGVVDYLTGRELVVSAFYLLPTLLVAWVAGRWSGLIMGTLCTSVWFLSDLLSGPAYQHPLIPVWNAMMLLVFFVVVVWLLTEFRHSHYQLEKTVERRTAALQAEVEEKQSRGQSPCGGARFGAQTGTTQLRFSSLRRRSDPDRHRYQHWTRRCRKHRIAGTNGVHRNWQPGQYRLAYSSPKQNGGHHFAIKQSDARRFATPDFIARIAAASCGRTRATAGNLYPRPRVDLNR